MNSYRDRITEILTNAASSADPRHVEAFMRCEHPTLDALSREQFACEVKIALDCIAYAGTADAEALARTYGL